MTDDNDNMENPAKPDPNIGHYGDDIDRSCRFIVSGLFSKAAGWLSFAMLIQVVVSLKLVYPAFIDSCPWMTYGKLTSVFQAAFIYGFLIQGFLGSALWMTARLGGIYRGGTGSMLIGLAGWNLALATAVIGIMAGYQTGYQWFILPSFSIPFLLVSYGILAYGVFMNFYNRKITELYPSQWFILAALFCFPWVTTTAWYLLDVNTIQGVMQSLVSYWFGRNLTMVCLVSFGLASVFYLVPKITGAELKERHLITFGFWALVIVGGWGGVPLGAPFPAWITGVSAVAQAAFVVVLVPLLVSLYSTDHDCRYHLSNPTLRWVVVGICSLVLVVLIDLVVANRLFNAVLEYTFVMEGRNILLLWGFGASLVFASVYHINEQLFTIDLPRPKLVQIHFILSFAGLLISIIALTVGGFLQGLTLLIPQSPFIYVVKIYKPFLWLFLLGNLAFAAGQWAFFINLSWQWCLQYCKCCGSKSCVSDSVETNATIEVEA